VRNRYSDEQVNRAKSINLEQYLSRRGETLKRAGNELKWIYRDGSGTHDSVTIRNDKWFDHKRQQGGDAIGFLQEFMGLSFQESVAELLGGEQGSELHFKSDMATSTPQRKREFIPPEKAATMRNLYAYLTKTRFISADIITHFVKAGTLYQEAERNNIVFLGVDENGVARAGSKKSANSNGSYKGTITDSKTEFGFGHKGAGDKLFTFEAPIDLLSYLTIYPENWQEQSYVALDGLSPKAMLHFLEKNPQISEINICIDHDEAGIEAYDKHRDLLIEAGYEKACINRVFPVYKDWNESLKAEHGLKPIPAQSHPKIEAYKNIAEKLLDFYCNTGQNYVQRFAGYFAENGLPGAAKVICQEYGKYQNCIDSGKIAKVISSSANDHLFRMANFCAMTFAEMVHRENPTINKMRIYHAAVNKLVDDFKPYQDKGKLKNHCDNLEQTFQTVKNSIVSDCEMKTVSAFLRDFADSCIKTKVYIETKYEQDLIQQESLLRYTEQKPTQEIVEDAPDEQFTMQINSFV
jgi:hypothetical protein